MKKTSEVLHEKAVQISKTYLRSECDLIAILQEIDALRAYRDLGYKSLFEYATQGLKLSESVSYNLITVARKSKEVPQLQEMIRKQELTVSNARMIAPVLNRENQAEWLAAAATLSKRALEKEIAKTLPERLVQESVKYVSEKRIELKLGISEDLHEKLKRVQDLVSSQSGKAAKMEDALQAALEIYIEKMDPQKEAERAQRKIAQAQVQVQSQTRSLSQSSSQPPLRPVPGQVSPGKSVDRPMALGELLQSSVGKYPRYIPARLKHAVRHRDKGQCALKDASGKRCTEKRWLEIHHIKPVADGGVNELENLALVCRAHHQFLHH